jgi:type III secretion protein V
VRVPGVRMRGSELPAGCYGVMLAETLVATGTVLLDRVWTSASPRELARHGVTATAATHPRTGGEASWIAAGEHGFAAIAPDTTATPLEYLVMHVQTVIESNLALFVGVQEVHELLAGAELLDPVRARPGALTAFARSLRGLVTERVPIHALRALWAGFEGPWQSGASIPAIIEQLRALPEIKRVLPGNGDSRRRYVLGDALEAAVRGSLDRGGAVPVFAMTPELCQQTLTAVRETVDAATPGVIVCAADVRQFVRKLVELEFSNLPVVSRDELLGTAEPAGTIDLRPRSSHD